MQLRLTLELKDGADEDVVIDDLDYSFTDTTGEARVIDTEIVDSQVEW